MTTFCSLDIVQLTLTIAQQLIALFMLHTQNTPRPYYFHLLLLNLFNDSLEWHDVIELYKLASDFAISVKVVKTKALPATLKFPLTKKTIA